jgi:hypothetical protein
MTDKAHAARKPRTHFEQIPVEAVKKIAESDVSAGADPGTDNLIVEPVARGTNRVAARSLDRKTTLSVRYRGAPRKDGEKDL